MAAFVHMALADDVASIRRGGLHVGKHRPGVYAVPVTAAFYPSHQWGREIGRARQKPMVAVYFRVKGDTPALFGPFKGPHVEGTADAAVAALIATPSPLGFETIFPADIPAAAITSIRRLPKKTGWRYFPTAKGRQPCPCRYCQRGEPYASRIAQATEERVAERRARRARRREVTMTGAPR